MRRRIPGVRFDDEIKDAEADLEKAVEVLGGEGARVERPLMIQSGLPEAKAHDRFAPHVGRKSRFCDFLKADVRIGGVVSGFDPNLDIAVAHGSCARTQCAETEPREGCLSHPEQRIS